MGRLLSWLLALVILAAMFVATVYVQRQGLGTQDDICDGPLPKQGTVFEGPVRYVADGDSLCIRTHDGLVEVRLADFNAPEMNQTGGARAREILRQIAEGQTVECTAGRRTWDRVAAMCVLDGASLGDRMRQAGAPGGGN